MKAAAATLVLCAGLAFAPAACGGDDEGGSSSMTATESASVKGATTDGQASSSRKRRGLRIRLMDTPGGKILINAKGQVLYLFTKESGSRSRCYGACARAWPPASTSGKPRAGKGVDPDLLGTTKRRGGGRIATYNGHPLYYYAHEEPRQVLCQAINEFGGIWYVVAPGGDAILERFSVS